MNAVSRRQPRSCQAALAPAYRCARSPLQEELASLRRSLREAREAHASHKAALESERKVRSINHLATPPPARKTHIS